ncbi:MAG: hypothetical protein AAF725_08970 [Acidobacteriota bacterium]
MDEVALARRLIQAADEARDQHPARALQRALCARDFAASLDVGESEALDHETWSDLQSDAWAALGSAHRSTADLQAAESCLQVALTFLEARAEADPRRRARLAQRAAYVRSDQGRFDEALDLLADARTLYVDLGEAQKAACARVDRALVLKRSGRPQAAIEELSASLETLDREAEPRSYLAAVHNMAHALLETAADEAEENEALRWLELAFEEHGRRPAALNVLRLRAVAALTASRLGRPSHGLAELRRLADEFARLGAAEDQALALLHTAELTLSAEDVEPAERASEVLRLSGRLFPLMARLPLDEDAHEALLGLMAGARRRELTVDAVRRAARLVEKSVQKQKAG